MEMTFKGLTGTVVVRRGGRLSQLRQYESGGVAGGVPPQWSLDGYNWQRTGCTVPSRPSAATPAGRRSNNASGIGMSTDPGAQGSAGSGSSDYISTECDMGQSSNNVSFNALSPYITQMEAEVSNPDGSTALKNQLNFPTVGHRDEPRVGWRKSDAYLIVKCWFCFFDTAEIWIGGKSIAGKIVGGKRCEFDAAAYVATNPLGDPDYQDEPEKLAAVYKCKMPSGQGSKSAVWIVTDSGPSGEDGGMNGNSFKNVIRYKSPKITTYESSYECDVSKDGELCATTQGGTMITIKGDDFGEPGRAIACVLGVISNEVTERCFPTISNDDVNHGIATFTYPPGIGGDLQEIYLRVQDQESRSISEQKHVRYATGVVVGSLFPPRRATTGGYEVEIFGYDFADSVSSGGAGSNSSTMWVMYGDVPCLVQSSRFDRVVCIMGDSTRSTSGSSDAVAHVGEGTGPTDVPSVQKCATVNPEQVLAMMKKDQTTMTTREKQLYNSKNKLQSKEELLVQDEIERTGGLAAALIAADSVEAMIAQGEGKASSLQLAVFAQANGGYYWTNVTTGEEIWLYVTEEQKRNADAAWAMRDAALAETEKTADKFQLQILRDSKDFDIKLLARKLEESTAGGVVDTWTKAIAKSAKDNVGKSATEILMRAAQLFGSVSDGYTDSASAEMPILEQELTEQEKLDAETAKTIGRLEKELSEAVSELEKKLSKEQEVTDQSLLESEWPSGQDCGINVTCSMLRLRLHTPDPSLPSDLETVARDSSCVSSDKSVGGAKGFDECWDYTDGNCQTVLDLVRAGKGSTEDYGLVAALCVRSREALDELAIKRKAESKIQAAREAAETGTATGEQLQLVIPGYYDAPYPTEEIQRVHAAGASASAADVKAVNALLKTKQEDVREFQNDAVVGQTTNQVDADKCSETGVLLSPSDQQVCDAQRLVNPCYPKKCPSDAPQMRAVYFHPYNSTLPLLNRSAVLVENEQIIVNDIRTDALMTSSDGKEHRILVEIQGEYFGMDETKINITFVSVTASQTAKTIQVPWSDLVLRDEIIAAKPGSKLRSYSPPGLGPDGWTYTAGTRLFFWCPPGQGRHLVIRVTRTVVGETLPLVSTADPKRALTYSSPTIRAVFTESPYRYAPKNSGPTDGCTTGAWESLLQWAARVEGVTDEERSADPSRYGRMCTKWHTVVMEGANFGADPSLLTVSAIIGKRVYSLHDGPGKYMTCDDRCGAWYTNPPFGVQSYYRKECGARPYFVPQMEHSHMRLVLCAPRGYGADLSISVDVASQPGVQATPAKWNFETPELTATFPNPYNGMGTETAATKALIAEAAVGQQRTPRTLEIRGHNFGAVAYVPMVIINGKICESPAWYPEHPVDGFPYITCEVQPNVVGSVNMSFFVADQWSKKINIISNIRRAPIRSECVPSVPKDDGSVDNYWGRVGELCVACVKGEICTPSTYLAPVAMPGFWMETLDVSGVTDLDVYPEATGTADGGKLLSDNDVFDLDMAKGTTYNDKVLRKCPPGRLLDAQLDVALVDEFPLAVATKKDTCTFAAACMPQEACNGSNVCHPNYEGSRLMCEIWHNDNVEKVADSRNIFIDGPNNTAAVKELESDIFACNHTLQCRSRAGLQGPSCGRAIRDVCQCEADWKASGLISPMACLKACIRTPSKLQLLLKAGCRSGEQLGAAMTGANCAGNSPEECSICVPDTDVSTGETRGTCQCQSSRRCVVCSYMTHYRMEGKCEKCPDNPELVIAGLVVGLLLLCIGTYILDKQDFNLAFISIGVDYFQVLALFASADVRWPAELKTLFRMLSFFNLNIDIAAPECLMPSFKYEWKFYGTLLAPIAFAVLFLGSTLCKLPFDRFIMNKKTTDKFYLSKMIGAFMLLMYYLYLMTAKRALEIFNCNPSEPDDGFLYTQFNDEECDGGMCRCNDPNHIQVRLQFPAVLGLFLYTAGYPILVYYLLRKNKKLIKEDQLLRSMGTGDTPGNNKNAYHIRRKYHKLYYHFKPGKWYWIVAIIMRKAGIVAAGLMFRVNPGFQLSLILLVLFSS